MSRTQKPYPYPHSKLFPDLNPSMQFLSVAEVAIILKTSTRLVLEWVNQGLLRSFRIGPKGRLIRVRQKDLEAFIDAHICSGDLSLEDPAGNEESQEIPQSESSEE